MQRGVKRLERGGCGRRRACPGYHGVGKGALVLHSSRPPLAPAYPDAHDDPVAEITVERVR